MATVSDLANEALLLYREIGHDDVYASGCLKAVYETWISCSASIKPSLPDASFGEMNRQVQATMGLLATDTDLGEMSTACRPALLLVLSASANKLETIRTHTGPLFEVLDSHYRARLPAEWNVERRKTVHDVYCIQVAQLILSMRIASERPEGRLSDHLGVRFRLILRHYYQQHNRATDNLVIPL